MEETRKIVSLFSPRSKTIEIAEPLMAIYFQPARHLRAHTRAHMFSLDLDSTPSAFLTATRLLSKPIPRVGPRGSGHPPTFYRLLDTLRRRIISSLSFSRYRSHFLSLALAVVLFLSLSLSLSRHTDTKWIYVRAHRSISRRLFSKPLAEDVWKISRMILDE